MSKGMRIACVSFFIIAGFLIYSNVIIDGIFIFDDFEYVIGNSLIQSFFYFDQSDPRQVGYLSFALNHAIWGENASAYHFVNVCIHVINALLVFFLIGLVLKIAAAEEDEFNKWRFATALFAGFIFLVHPAQTQAVSYITQRFTSLCAMFYILSVVLYLMARIRLEKDSENHRGYMLYAFSILSALLAMKTKEIAFTIPFTATVFEMLMFRESRYLRRRFIYLIPFYAALFIIPLSLFGPEWGWIKPPEGIAEVVRKDKLYDFFERSPFAYLFTQFRVLIIYIRLLFLPVSQRVIYDITVSYSFFELKVLLSLAVLLAIAYGAFYSWRKAGRSSQEDAPGYKLISIGIIWFFLTISIESSIIPIKDIIFEHRIYLPSVGFIAAFSVLLMQFVRRVKPGVSETVKIGAVFLLIGLPLAAGTYLRNNVWTDELKFWDDVVKKTPRKAIGYNNRGNAYAHRGQYELALRDLDRTVSDFTGSDRTAWENADFTPSNMAKTYLNRGQIYALIGDMQRANEDFERAKKVMMMPPNMSDVFKMAELYYSRGAYSHAVEEYNKILAWNEENINALNNRGNAYSRNQQYKEAIQDFDKAISLNPDFVMAYHNRGIAYAWMGDKNKAADDFRAACNMGFQPACESIDIVLGGDGKVKK